MAGRSGELPSELAAVWNEVDDDDGGSDEDGFVNGFFCPEALARESLFFVKTFLCGPGTLSNGSAFVAL